MWCGSGMPPRGAGRARRSPSTFLNMLALRHSTHTVSEGVRTRGSTNHSRCRGWIANSNGIPVGDGFLVAVARAEGQDLRTTCGPCSGVRIHGRLPAASPESRWSATSRSSRACASRRNARQVDRQRQRRSSSAAPLAGALAREQAPRGGELPRAPSQEVVSVVQPQNA